MTISRKPDSGLEVLDGLVNQLKAQKHILSASFSKDVTTGDCIGQSGSEVVGWKDPEFNPKRHLATMSPPKTIYTFQDLGLEKPITASSDVAGTVPFPLFSKESIPLIRRVLLNPRYLNETAAVFGSKTLIIRNTATHSPFFRRLWTHPSVLNALSNAAGVALEPVMDTMELGHANVQVDFRKYAGWTRNEILNAVSVESTSEYFAAAGQPCDEVRRQSQEEVETAVAEGALLPWHYDSYPWVCVAMVSDTSNMLGGETVIHTGSGEYKGIAQPGMGSAMMLQGGLIKHLALPSASPNNDRITIITSFRAKAVDIYDSSFLSNTRPYSDLHELYRQWIDYRLNRLEPGVKKFHDRRRSIKAFDEKDGLEELEEQIALKEYAKRTLRQMVPVATVKALAARLECSVFCNVRDDYVNGTLFKQPLMPCPFCANGCDMVEKRHLAVCPASRFWRPRNPLWSDCAETTIALQENGLQLRKLMEELQVQDVILKWTAEQRPWGIVDEMAVQGLGEYIIEFVEFFGVKF